MQARSAPSRNPLAALGARDVAEVVDVEPGPSPLRRACYGIAVGLVAGVLATALIPRPGTAFRRTHARER